MELAKFIKKTKTKKTTTSTKLDGFPLTTGLKTTRWPGERGRKESGKIVICGMSYRTINYFRIFALRRESVVGRLFLFRSRQPRKTRNLRKTAVRPLLIWGTERLLSTNYGMRITLNIEVFFVFLERNISAEKYKAFAHVGGLSNAGTNGVDSVQVCGNPQTVLLRFICRQR